jgi:peptidoglycan/xylan/chitin deacetylase (PgdA/CDA1 family)
MRIVSPLLKRVVYPTLSKVGIFHHTSASGLAVVTYHGVVPLEYASVDAALDGNLVSADTLRQQLRLLKTHYNVISPEDALAWRQGRETLPKRAVLITCDDGLLNCLTEMLPVLQQESVKCLFFVTGASAGELRSMLWYEELFLLLLRAPDGPFSISAEGIEIQEELGSRNERRALWWNLVKKFSQLDAEHRSVFSATLRARFRFNAEKNLDNESASCRRYGLLTSTELRQLAAAGMSIGAHSMSHPMLSQMPRELAFEEISKSRLQLESALGQKIWAFAYPFGGAQSVTPEVIAMTQKAGYSASFLNFGGGLGSSLPPYALPRIHVTADMSLAELDAHVSGFYMRLQRRTGRSAQSASMAQSTAF